MRYSVGIDIGATKILAGLVREDGTVVHRVRRTTPFDSRDGVVETTCEMVREVVLFGQTQDCCPAGIGVGTAGQVNFAEGIVVSGTPNIRDWTGVKLGELLSASANLPVWVDNDVNAHLLAEVSIGVAAGRQNVLMLALGTGVGEPLATNPVLFVALGVEPVSSVIFRSIFRGLPVIVAAAAVLNSMRQGQELLE
ncbi:hypothetical protein GCM10025859_35930 [Alicyclobacillus fastidiosus]|nr:hypothetical protein GCM10025859_35930 [Alicyclobacillus fastidiosus]